MLSVSAMPAANSTVCAPISVAPGGVGTASHRSRAATMGTTTNSTAA